MTERRPSDPRIASWDELIAQHAGDADPELREQVGFALVSKGGRLAFELAQPEEAIRAWEEVVRLYSDATEPVIRQYVKVSLFKKALVLMELKPRDEARSVYRQIAERYAPNRSPQLRAVMARCFAAFVRLAILLRLQGPWGAPETWAANRLEAHPPR